jgi:hypothetical protein
MLCWSLAFVALLVVAPAAQGHVGHQVFPISELTDTDLAQIDLRDGSVEEWQNIIGEPALTARDFYIDPLAGDGPDYDPADLDFRVWLGWHQPTSRIYVAVESSDNAYINNYEGLNSPNVIVYHDFMGFMVDGDHSGGEYTFGYDDFSTREEWAQVSQTQAQHYFTIARTPDARHANLMFFDDWYTLPPYVEGGGGVLGEAPTISVIEFYVTPFDRLVKDSQEETKVSVLFPGKIIGFAMHVADFDRAPNELHADYLLPPQNRAVFTADLFADGVLVGVDGVVPEVPATSAVEEDSWGWIKGVFESEP